MNPKRVVESEILKGVSTWKAAQKRAKASLVRLVGVLSTGKRGALSPKNGSRVYF